MELEEMKAAWDALSKKVEKQEKLTQQMIEKMTEQKYQTRLNKISYPESIGTLISFLGAFYVIINFTKIDNMYLQACALIAIALLSILPIISLTSLHGMNNLNISTRSYSDTIKIYAHHKIRFQRLQQFSVLYGFFLMVVSLPISMDILGKDMSVFPNYWTVIFPVCTLVFLGFACWVIRYYNRTLNKAENILSEIDNYAD